MKLGGWQKLTLLDFPECTACTVFCAGCNFRCPFCYNTPLVLGAAGDSSDDGTNDAGAYNEASEEDFFAFLSKRAGLLDGVCVTGGEPTLQAGLYGFIARIRSMGYKVKLDTNGTRPDVVEKLISDGMLDYVAMDIKSSRERYAEACGIAGFDTAPVERSVSLLAEGRVRYEFRTTVMRELHSAPVMEDTARWLSGECAAKGNEPPAYYIQSYKDMDELVGGGHMTAFSPEELGDLLTAVRKYIPSAKLRGVDG